MNKHRNSQKRQYRIGASYFITANTYKRYPYFYNDYLSELFIEQLILCQKLKKFELQGYKVNPDHIHILLQPGEHSSYSEIMHSVKRNFSINANKVILNEEIFCSNDEHANTPYSKFNQRLLLYRHIFNNNPDTRFIPRFKWQKSFHYHRIENNADFFAHIQYLKKQWIKHRLKENKWLWINNT